MSDKSHLNDDTPVRPHSFDGIEEYDKKMPNWWLNIFYVSLGFAMLYWLGMERFSERSQAMALEDSMERIETIRLLQSEVLDDGTLWQMSRNAAMVSAGKATYMANCASCHGNNLEGGIGANLASGQWINTDGSPVQILHTVENGILAKGMPAWGSVLGQKSISEIVAFVLSHHEPK